MVPRDGIDQSLRVLILKVYLNLPFLAYPSMYPALNNQAKAVWSCKQRNQQRLSLLGQWRRKRT